LKPLARLQALLHRRGIVIVISDFYEDPAAIVQAIKSLRFRGNDVALFHILDSFEIDPDLKTPTVLVDMESDRKLEVTPEYVSIYRAKIQAHIQELRELTQASGLDYHLFLTDKPLDSVLRQYLSLRRTR